MTNKRIWHVDNAIMLYVKVRGNHVDLLRQHFIDCKSANAYSFKVRIDKFSVYRITSSTCSAIISVNKGKMSA